MKTSKTLMLAAVFSFAVASAWVAGVSLAGAQTTPPPAKVKKTYNSGQSTTGYTQANPVNSNGFPAGGNWGNTKNGGVPGLKQGK